MQPNVMKPWNYSATFECMYPLSLPSIKLPVDLPRYSSIDMYRYLMNSTNAPACPWSSFLVSKV